MKLDDIGFYTLSDERAKTCSPKSTMKRCEIVITDACNFKCPYCRGLRGDIKGTLSYIEVINIIDIMAKDKLENIRFSGGEPTTHKYLKDMVSYAKSSGVKRIAVSTNGFTNRDLYDELMIRGVNDFSISLDACCATYGKKMCGGVEGAWEKVVENIRYLSKRTYVTVGMVFTKDNYAQAIDTIKLADSLGVSDIRIIPAAQQNRTLKFIKKIPQDIVNKYPILKYRVNNYKEGKHVRGLQDRDCRKCHLAVDDTAIVKGYHFPCIIYMREQGNPIGKVSPNMRKERAAWIAKHNTWLDPICRKNCLDTCIFLNNKIEETNDTKTSWDKF